MSTFITKIDKIGDPFVLLKDGIYYMYATSPAEANGFKVWTSKDLKEWDLAGQCYQKTDDCFGYCDFWAPEVKYNEKTKKYVMHYSARDKQTNVLKTGVATADSPLGPFVDAVKGKPMFDFGKDIATIDATCFVDDDGQAYLYFVKDCSMNVINGVHTSQIYCARLTDDFLSLNGEIKLISTPDQEWEISRSAEWQWNEGPYVVKHDGKYYMTYSSNCFDCAFYSVGVAISDSPMGKFVKEQDNPVLAYIEGITSGPGHNMFFNDKNGNMTCAYHIHTDRVHPGADRTVAFSPAYFKDGKLVIDYK